MTLRQLRRLAAQAVFILLAWFFFGGLFTWQQHSAAVTLRGEDDLRARAWAMLLVLLIWALMTPFVLAIAERLPIRRPHRIRNVFALIALCVFLAAIRAVGDAHLPALFGRELPQAELRTSALWLFHSHFLLAVLLVGIANVVRLQREAGIRRTSEARFVASLANARLRRLRADLHPHFLFNALNAVAALVHTKPDDAERTLDSLVDLLRRSIASQDVLEVPLADEIAFVAQYLDIQKTRFGDRLTTAIEADPSLLGAAIPPLLLQPLVENAIVHGVGQRSDGGRVVVRADRHEGWLRLQVRDDGPGCDPAVVLRHGSIGVPNAKARLQFVYGDAHSLSYRREDGEFVAEVLIPMRRPNSHGTAVVAVGA